MSNTKKRKPATPAVDDTVVDVDAMLADTTPLPEVVLTFRGQRWTFRGMSEAPLHLFDESLDEASSAVFFIKTMLADGQDALPDDLTMREATTIVSAYTRAATGGLTAGE